MAKGLIDENFIQNLLARVDIVDVISAFVDLKGKSKNYLGLCPFHNEKTPSFSVNADKQFYHCFGCGVSGDAITFIREIKNMDFVEAVEYLANFAGMQVEYSDRFNPSYKTQAQQNAQKNREQRASDLLSACAIFYRENFYQDRFIHARKYWQNRQLSYDTAKIFGIGYASGSGLWEHLQQQNFSFEEVVEQGLLNKDKHGAIKEKFWQRLIFPIQDTKGRVIAFGGRVLDNHAKPKYLNSPETFLFDKSRTLYGLFQVKNQNKKVDRVLITEGYLDVISLYQAGINYAVATMGTAISSDHIKQLLKVSKNLVFCFDGDSAGFKAAERALVNILPYLHKIEEVRFLILEAGEDPDSIIKKQGKKLFETRMNSAIPVVEFFLEFIGANKLDSSLDSKIKFVNNAIEYLALLPKDIFASNFIINKVATLAETKVANIQIEIDKYLQKQQAKQHNRQNFAKIGLAFNAVPAFDNQINSYIEPNETLTNSYYEEMSYANNSNNYIVPTNANYATLKREKYLHAQSTYLLKIVLQQPSLAKQLDDYLIENLQDFNYGVFQKIKDLATSRENLSKSDIFAYWYGTQIGNYLVDISKNSIIFDDIENQFTQTQTSILANLNTQKLIADNSNLDATNSEESVTNLLEKLKRLKELKK